MHQDLSSSQAPLAADSSNSPSWSHGLPGFRLTHIIHVVSDVNLDVVARAAAQLKSAHATVSNWTFVERGGVLEQKIVLNDIGEPQARVVREQLFTIDDVRRVRLEHCFVRHADTERRSQLSN